MTDATQDLTVSEFLSEAQRRLAEMAEAIADLRRGAAARKSLAMAAQVVRDRAAVLGFDTVALQAGWILARSDGDAREVPLALLEEAVDLLRQRIAALSGAPRQGGPAEGAGGQGPEEAA